MPSAVPGGGSQEFCALESTRPATERSNVAKRIEMVGNQIPLRQDWARYGMVMILIWDIHREHGTEIAMASLGLY